jgi:uncharacterized OsmC-like protein
VRPPSRATSLGGATEEIEREGSAEVTLAGRSFRIGREFVESTRDAEVLSGLGGMRRALLVLHSPVDDVVSIDEAGRIFKAARHPKSFVSLDAADHLLSDAADAQYVAVTILAWADRYLPAPEAPPRRQVAGGEVVVSEGNTRFLRHVTTDDHQWLADEPRNAGGDNLGPDPYEHLLAALGACTSMTIRMYANRKSWPLDSVTVRLGHHREHDRDCEDCDSKTAQLDVIERFVEIEGELTADQQHRLMQIADRCPVHRTLEGRIDIRTVREEAD